MSPLTVTDSTRSAAGTRLCTPNRSNIHPAHSRADTAIITRQPFHAPSTRKERRRNISATNQPTAVHSTTSRVRGRPSATHPKNTAVKMPMDRPVQKATPQRNTGRTTGMATTSPADSAWRR